MSFEVAGRCGDGSDKNISDPIVEEKLIFKVIRKLEAIDEVRLKVALQE